MAQFIQFGEWLPDLPAFQNPGLTEAENVFPDAASYKSVPNLSAFSVNALGARCQGAVVAVDGDGNTYNVVGDTSALYLMVSSTFVNVTRAVTAGTPYVTNFSQGWEFSQFGNRLLAVNGYVSAVAGNIIQELSLSTGTTQFHNLVSTAGSGLNAYTIATVRDFVVIGNVFQLTSASGVYSQRVRWCAINNPDSWTADAATLADHQDLVGEGGPVVKVIGGEYGVVMQRKAIWRMTFVGSPLVFQFDNVQRNVGLVTTKAAVSYQNLVFFLSDDGFYVFDGSTVTPIGRGRIDDTFFAEVNKAQLHRINAVIHPENKLVLWAYPTGANTDPDKVLVYNWAFNRWSRLTLATELLATQISAGGAVTLAAFDTTHAMDRFAGSAMAATISTGEMQLFPDRRATIHEVRPYVLGGNTNSPGAQVAVARRDLFTQSSTFGTAVSPNTTGFAPVRSSGRYHRIRVTTTNNGSFTHLQGVDIDAAPEGVR